MSASKGTIGIVGLGIMGGAIAGHLARAGWRVIGYDIDVERCREAKTAGAELAHDAADVAKAAPAVLTSLPNPAALHETVQKISEAGSERRIVAELSTFSLDDKEKAASVLRKSGHVMLDCPLSGTGSQAKAKDLVVYASGDRESIAHLMPVFADFSRLARDVGPFGNGTKMKFVANLLVAIHNVAAAEALVLGMKAGLAAKDVYELATSGAGSSRMLEVRGPMMVENRYDGDNLTMRNATWQKDMKVIGGFAQSIGCPTPMFSACEAIYRATLGMGYAEQDTGAVCAVLAEMAGVKR